MCLLTVSSAAFTDIERSLVNFVFLDQCCMSFNQLRSPGKAELAFLSNFSTFPSSWITECLASDCVAQFMGLHVIHVTPGTWKLWGQNS